MPIKQVYFDAIIEGTKKEEYREIKMGTTANKYLLKDSSKKYVLNTEVTDPNKEYYVDDYNNGNFPFIPKQYKYLSLAVGYAKERDTAIVSVESISFQAERVRVGLFCFWVIVYHIGEVIEVKRK